MYEVQVKVLTYLLKLGKSSATCCRPAPGTSGIVAHGTKENHLYLLGRLAYAGRKCFSAC